MNLPNKLTLARVVMIPFFMIFLLFPIIPVEWISRVVAAAIFALTALTDMLDGKIARKYGLITDFGKFLDPLADKVMVISAMLSLIYVNRATILCEYLVWATFIIVVRELAVTSLRLIVNTGEKIVIAANWLGKIKTVSQIVCILSLLLEPVILPTYPVISFITLAATVILTVWSGVNYFVAYLPHISFK